MLNIYGKRTRDILACFYFYYSLIFFILRAFLVTQLFRSRLLEKNDKSQRGARRLSNIPHKPSTIVV